LSPPFPETKPAAALKPGSETWYGDWQNRRHVRLFDSRSRLNDRALVRHFSRFSDVLLLDGIAKELKAKNVLEVGCATGEFHRYLRQKHPALCYVGVDLSAMAIERARQKYPEASFRVCREDLSVQENLATMGLDTRFEMVYSKDVLHHQPDPFRFLEQLRSVSRGALVLRTRTRDTGATVLDPQLSCQHTYEGWVPYIVLNLQELISFFQKMDPTAEIRVVRQRTVLGGEKRRFLPKECYLPETGTAETTVGVLFQTRNPSRVDVRDGLSGEPLND